MWLSVGCVQERERERKQRLKGGKREGMGKRRKVRLGNELWRSEALKVVANFLQRYSG